MYPFLLPSISFPIYVRTFVRYVSYNSRERKRMCIRRCSPPPCLSSSVYVNINASVALALALSSSSRSISLAHLLSFSQSLPLFFSLPFSPSTVSSNGEESHSRLPTLILNYLLHERALIFPSFRFFFFLAEWTEKIIIIEKNSENSVIRMWWCSIDRSFDCEMTMPLRVPSELSDSLHVYSCLHSTMDSMRTMMFFFLLLSSSYSPDNDSAVEFWLFFWLFLPIIYANLGKSFTVHHRAGRSREDGEGMGDHRIRVLTQVGVAERREIQSINSLASRK